MAVSLVNIIKFVGDKMRPMSEGEAVFNAGHVSLCGFKKDKSSDIKEIVGFVLQTSNIQAEPHRVNIILNEEWQAKCSCKAGAGGMCKHIVAVLIYANRHSALDELSCTDLEQKWGQFRAGPSTSGNIYSEALPMKDYCHPTNKRSRLDKLLNKKELEDLKEMNFAKLRESDPNSAIAKSQEGRHLSTSTCSLPDPDPEQEKYMDYETISIFMSSTNLILNNNLIDTNNKFYKTHILKNIGECKIIYNDTLGQRSSTWHLARKYRITGSTCYSLYTYFKGKHTDWTKKIENLFNPSFGGSSATTYGLTEEPRARLNYERCTGLKVLESGFVINPILPWLGFSPDGINSLHELIEIKCPILGKTMSATDMTYQLPYLNFVNGEVF